MNKAHELVQRLIKSSIQRAIQESVAAAIVLAAFTAILIYSEVGSLRYFGCLLILVGTGFIAGVVWSFALSYQLLRTHPVTDSLFWREAFQSQARLLRYVPLWYCGPLAVGCMLFIAPTQPYELFPFLLVAAVLNLVFAGVIWLNRKAAARLEEQATQLD